MNLLGMVNIPTTLRRVLMEETRENSRNRVCRYRFI